MGARVAAFLAALLTATTTGSYPSCSCPSNPGLCQPLAPTQTKQGRDVHVYSDCGGPWESATKKGNSSCDWRQFDFSVVKTIVRMSGHSLQITAARAPTPRHPTRPDHHALPACCWHCFSLPSQS